MTETQERFLRAVLSRVAIDSVVELHLFPPIRRGTLETGVAVIATVIPPPPLAVMPDEPAVPVTLGADMESDGTLDDQGFADEFEELVGVITIDVTPGASDTEELVGVITIDVTPGASDTEERDESAVVEATAARPAIHRLRILTASYRHTIKGIERGKWTVDVQEEADAPREAVEAVLRGVRHRSAEPADPELVSHDALAALLTQVAVAPAA